VERRGAGRLGGLRRSVLPCNKFGLKGGGEKRGGGGKEFGRLGGGTGEGKGGGVNEIVG
jgi:hypothetical protein